MAEVAQIFPKAFAVRFAQIDRWDPSSFHGINWRWPGHFMATIGSVLSKRKEKVDRGENGFNDLMPVTIHFDGSIDPRKVKEDKEYRMELFWARPGDIVVSKIDLKNGAVAIVPGDWDKVVVTNHFAVYEPNLEKVDPRYFCLLIQAKFFKEYLWRNKVGAEGRKEVKLDFFESQKIPVPPLPIQKKIVAHWVGAQAQVNHLLHRAEKLLDALEGKVLGELGLNKKKTMVMPKVMVGNWAGLAKWNQRATFLLGQTPDLSKGIYPVVSGRECMAEVKHGCSASPSGKPTTLKVLKLSAVTSGQFLPSEAKYIADKKQFRESFGLARGDILMCRTNGTLAYVGRPAILEKDCPGLIFPDKLMRVRCKANVLPEYLEYVLSSSIARPQLEANARTAVGNYAIGNDDVFNVELPLPPISVQEKIIKVVQEARSESGRAKNEAMRLKGNAEKEIEEMILGARPVEVR